MKCAIALDINEGKYLATEEQFKENYLHPTAVVHPEICSVKR
jgi:hypothetical protein